MTKYFFDTDCLSSFAWAHREDLVFEVLEAVVVLPKAVENELKRVPHLYARIAPYINQSKVIVQDIEMQTAEETLYNQFTISPQQNKRVIGSGEAACLALAIVNNGVVASNNLRDVKDYCEQYHLTLVSTADIMKRALEKSYIDLNEGRTIWNIMLSKKRKLPFLTFDAYLDSLK